MPSNEIDTIAARLALADVVLAAVKESALLKPRRNFKARGRKAAATRARNKRAASKAPKSGSKPSNPLKNVPDEQAA